ncbi:TIGR01666 family membrane protein [Pigmentiphaga sp. NML080357]|uniref:YccS family putative transporter n=1 Tax=Pigmentiphaga sp. NML080357 TaxID=2008675 RepID=UPI000B407C00|nr:YccS family putative transporter [Pigmentiphaga sp. NML080357]OVZ61266.1 TIGR01666 family membrane protein [Pigmentiphaga sp. NML080357]
MGFASLLNTLRRLWAHDTFVYSLRVFIALASVMGLCWGQGRMDLVIPAFLGVIACALAETDDNWRGRLLAQLVTLACFAVAAIAVKALFPYPWLFLAGMALSTFCLTMLGAIGERYRAMGYATLILAIYTTIGVEQSRGGGFWREPALLMAGAAWYGALSVLWSALFAHQPVQQRLAGLYAVLGDYLVLKAALFEPVRGIDVEARRLELAQLNSKVVAALNAAKESIFSRLGRSRPGRKTARYLRLYFIAQDVHERASSSHYPYNDLADAFFHSDIMFRCQRLLSLQGHACRRLARAIRMRQPFDAGDETRQARADLDASLDYLRRQNRPEWARLLRSVGALSANLAELDRRLGSASNPDKLDEQQQDNSLFDRSPQSLGEAVDRVRLQLTPGAPVFRYAVRLTLAMAAGYGMLHLVHPEQGYWIVLTTLFVCAPSYGATRTRLVQRVLGTVLGLALGWVLFKLFSSLLVQALFAVAAGVVFFATRSSRYMVGTAAITVLVLLCFNQIGNGYDLFVPRLVDTLLGALIAGVAVLVVLPDWQGRRLNQVAANALAANSRYLREIMIQYEIGKRDDLAYRLARRNAHNADAAFSMAMSNMLAEPGHFRRDAETGLRFLTLSHTLLNYLSGLGAHREGLADHASDAEIARMTRGVIDALDGIAAGLANRTPLAASSAEEEALARALEQRPDDDADDGHRLVLTQLALIGGLLGPLRKVASRLWAPPTR